MPIRFRLTALVVLLLCSLSVHASLNPRVEKPSDDGLWLEVDAPMDVPRARAERTVLPRKYRVFRLQPEQMRRILSTAPIEFSPGAEARAPILTLPLPDGGFSRFAVQESPIMSPELMAKLPEVRTYIVQGVDDRSASGRVDLTPSGFHGFVISGRGVVFIDPYVEAGEDHYLSFWRRDYAGSSDRPQFSCDVVRSERSDTRHVLTAASARTVQPQAASGSILRTYRLALAATGEYTAYHGGSVASAQSAMVTTMNRVNGIYEREVAIRMTMIDNSSIVFTNAASDPYANDSNDLAANQTTIDNAIGSSNYDIGHLFGTGGGGVAALGSVCWTGNKARGLTGSSVPVGDAFDVDYVAHEIGHQFGGEHTFNGTSGACSGNRVANSAYEPGSGSTIMAYAGICAPENLQLNSDSYFHGHSYDQIVSYSTDARMDYGGACPTTTLTNNSSPVVTAGSAITIPVSTPFELAGSATDANGDALTYAWEEFDLGTAAPPSTDDGSRPIFRSFSPVNTGHRTFPTLANILAGTTSFGESLPTTTRTMQFRLTVRDNKAGGGGVDYGTRQVDVTSTAGPFAVTDPASAVSWAGGSSQTVTWSVAGTTASPVNCAEVNILFSTDGGTTFETVASGSPNDGSQVVTVPNIATNTARVKVECTTVPFFDISNPDFTIAGGVPAPGDMVATALSDSTVRLSWTGISTATAYEIHRKGPGGGFVLAATYTLPDELKGSTSALSYDIAQPSSTAYIYKMQTVATGESSADGNLDAAVTLTYTDDPVSAGSTIVKAVHITELRTAMNAMRDLASLPAPTLTDSSLAGAPVKSSHIGELRSAIAEARTALSLPVFSYSTTAAVGTVIRGTEIAELRNALK